MLVPPNPKLVSYLRKNLPRFGEQALRDKLLEEDVAEEEIAAAMAEARRSPPKPPLLLRITVALLAGLIVFGLLYKEEETNKPPSNTSAGALNAPPEPSAPYIGNSGYMLKLPNGYSAHSILRDMGKTEIVFIYPHKVDPSHFNNEGLYGPLGLLRLEVSPRQLPQSAAGAAMLKSTVTAQLSKRGDVFTTRELLVGGLPGFVVNISKPFPSTRAFLIGGKVLYMLVGGNEDRLFNELLESINEDRR